MAAFSSSGGGAEPLPQLIVRDRDQLKLWQVQRPTPTEAAVVPGAPLLPAVALMQSPLPHPTGDHLLLLPERAQPLLCETVEGRSVLQLPINTSTSQRWVWSPRGTYICCWMPTSKDSQDDNLRIWRVSDGQLLGGHQLRQWRADCIQWSEDETLVCRQGTNELQIMSAEAPSTAALLARLHHVGFTQFKISMSSEGSLLIALFNPEAGGKPGKVTTYCYSTAHGLSEPLGSRGIFGASETVMSFGANQTLLVQAMSDVDKSNASYYGASALYLLTSCGTSALDSSKVEQTKAGHVHDAKWSPLGDRFAMSAGNMPCASTLFNDKGQAIYHFGSAHRNTICWSPHGRFLCLAGFGNLAGEMDFYDTQRLKKLGSNLSHCATAFEWSPCSRFFMTASLAPRMNVDNNVKIFRYDGHGPLLKLDFARAFDAFWLPVRKGTYPDRPATPRRREAEEEKPAEIAPAPAAAVYRPPGSSGSLASMMREQRQETGPVGKVRKDGTVATSSSGNNAKYVPPGNQRSIPGMPPQRVIPGMAPAQAGAQGKGKSTASKPSSGSSTTTAAKPSGGSVTAAAAKPTSAAGAAASKPTAASTPAAAAEAPGAESEEKSTEKRIRTIQKKLKQIQDIKDKISSGQSVDAEQRKKLNTEEALQAELRSLEA